MHKDKQGLFLSLREISTPGIDGVGPRMYKVIFAAAAASAADTRFD